MSQVAHNDLGPPERPFSIVRVQPICSDEGRSDLLRRRVTPHFVYGTAPEIVHDSCLARGVVPFLAALRTLAISIQYGFALALRRHERTSKLSAIRVQLDFPAGSQSHNPDGRRLQANFRFGDFRLKRRASPIWFLGEALSQIAVISMANYTPVGKQAISLRDRKRPHRSSNSTSLRLLDRTYHETLQLPTSPARHR